MTNTLHSGNSMMMAMELSNKKWKLAFSDGKKIRQKTVDWGAKQELLKEIERAREKFGLSADVEVFSCYEAGRDGFWIDRFLKKHGIRNTVVDPASIEVSRRSRRAKTDRLDAEKLVIMLTRYHWNGERRLWRAVRVPDEAAEDARRSHRGRQRLLVERNAHVNRIRSLLALHGIKVPGSLHRCSASEFRDWEGKALSGELLLELEQELVRFLLVRDQLKRLEDMQRQRIKAPESLADDKVAKLIKLKGVGQVSSWVLGKEFFGWRAFKNRREVGALAGLTGTPYSSGESNRELGISKAGNKRVRSCCVELAWGWLRFQPESELSKWYMERFGGGGARMKRIGIVALARKLLVALWKYVEKDELPAGAIVSA